MSAIEPIFCELSQFSGKPNCTTDSWKLTRSNRLVSTRRLETIPDPIYPASSAACCFQ